MTLEVWDDSIGSDHLWTNGNVGEAIPDVMTPATWSVVAPFMAHAMPGTEVAGRHAFGRVAGRFYLDLSMLVALAGTAGMPRRRLLRRIAPIFGELPVGLEVPPVALPRLRTLRGLVVGTVEAARRARRLRAGVAGTLAAVPGRCAAVRREIEAADRPALAGLWAGRVAPLFDETSALMDVARREGSALVRVPARLTRLAGPEDAALLTAAPGMASLGPVLGLAQLRAGTLDVDGFAERHGHRGPHEFELSIPRPAEEPHWRARQQELATTGPDPAELMVRQAAVRTAARDRLLRAHPRRARRLDRDLAAWARAAELRELVRSECVRVFGVIRAWVLRAGALLDIGDDAFLCSITELRAALAGAALPDLAVRRATYEHYRALPAPPPLVRDGRDATVADPGTGPLRGTGASGGVAIGTVRVLVDMSEGLEPGEVLVAATTNVGWTPLFPLAAAVVTDVGATLSHAAIVARELGVPAVVGCGTATERLRTGMRVRVDGTAGTVTVLG